MNGVGAGVGQRDEGLVVFVWAFVGLISFLTWVGVLILHGRLDKEEYV